MPHRDCGFNILHRRKPSMSRVAKCISNGPIEGFWGYNYERLQVELNSLGPMKVQSQGCSRVIFLSCLIDRVQFALKEGLFSVYPVVVSLIPFHFSCALYKPINIKIWLLVDYRQAIYVLNILENSIYWAGE